MPILDALSITLLLAGAISLLLCALGAFFDL